MCFDCLCICFICYLLLPLYLFYFGQAQAQSCPPGAKVQGNGYLRIQGRMQIFEKMSQKALNRVLTPAVDRSRRELSESSGIIEKGAFCVELWSFYCKKRISVPMSYITFLHSSICLQNVCFPHKLINYLSRMYAFRIS